MDGQIAVPVMRHRNHHVLERQISRFAYYLDRVDQRDGPPAQRVTFALRCIIMEYLIGNELYRTRTPFLFCDLLILLVDVKFGYRQSV